MPTFSVDASLVAGNFYRTQSAPAGHYQAYNDTLQTVDDLVINPGDPEQTLSPTQLNAPDCAIKGSTKGNRLRLRSIPRQAAMQGHLENGGILDKTVGQATLLLNIAGNMSLVASGPDGPPKVKVIARYIMDGEVWTSINNVLGALNASIDANISIDGLSVANANANQTGLVGGTLGVTPSLSPTGPGVQTAIGISSQTVASGVAIRNLAAIGELPIGVSIPWAFTMTARAENDKSPITGLGCSAALSLMTHLWVEVNLAAAGTDPLFSSSVFGFDAGTGLLGVAHPLAVLTPLESPAAILIESDGTPPTLGPTASLGDRQNLLPEVELIADGDRFSDNDALLGSILSYSNITFSQANADGTLSFTDGQLSFLDPTDLATVRASTDLTGISADPNSQTFRATIANFQFGSITAADSPFGAALENTGGMLDFDPEIIAVTDNFTISASTDIPWSVVITPA